eukprot:GILI01009853.1.p1 GENE.GILI01009853.1~~GILI01009853.1.p1  ORF type:complete len:271 (-),score=49.73 GILI01009853.1:123-827(-)
MAGTGYDDSVGTFSSDGRIFQVEYAAKLLESSSTVVGVCCKDGVVVGAEKIFLSRMLEDGAEGRVYAVDRQAGMAICGLIPDGKSIVSRAKEECEQNRDVFAVPLTGAQLADRVGQFMHMYTLYSGARPFGCSVLIASYADDGPQLYVSDPSGTTAGYHACALGKAKVVAKTELEKLDFSTITCREAVPKIAEIIYANHDKVKDKIWDVEFGWISDETQKIFTRVPKDLIPAKP